MLTPAPECSVNGLVAGRPMADEFPKAIERPAGISQQIWDPSVCRSGSSIFAVHPGINHPVDLVCRQLRMLPQKSLQGPAVPCGPLRPLKVWACVSDALLNVHPHGTMSWVSLVRYFMDRTLRRIRLRPSRGGRFLVFAFAFSFTNTRAEISRFFGKRFAIS